MLHSFAELKDFLAKRDIPVQADDARQVLEIPTYIRGEPHAALLVWDPRAILLHVIQPLAVSVPEDREAQVMEAIVRINHQLVLPGLGYDHERKTIYYRWVVPRADDGSVTEENLDRAIRVVLETCRDFLPGLRAVAALMPAAEIMSYSARIKEDEQRSAV